MVESNYNYIDSSGDTSPEQNLVLQQALMELAGSAPNRVLSRLVRSLVGVDQDSPITREM